MIPRNTVITIRPKSGNGGVSCCCFRCCTCLNLPFLKSPVGLLKLAQAILGSFCQSLALGYGLAYSGTIGRSFQSFLTTASWCSMTTTLLLFCYVLSEKSFGLVRQSLFETAFNTIAAFSYITTCSYLGYSVYIFLQPLYWITPHFEAYPAMSAAYMVGTVVGLMYAYDAYKSYQYFRACR